MISLFAYKSYASHIIIMATFIISFEILATDRDNQFKERLKKYGSYCPINNTCWAIVSNNSANQILEELETHVNSLTDKLFISKVGSEASWRNTYGPAWDDWLKKNLLQ
jgi:hypothetical protein